MINLTVALMFNHITLTISKKASNVYIKILICKKERVLSLQPYISQDNKRNIEIIIVARTVFIVHNLSQNNSLLFCNFIKNS